MVLREIRQTTLLILESIFVEDNHSSPIVTFVKQSSLKPMFLNQFKNLTDAPWSFRCTDRFCGSSITSFFCLSCKNTETKNSRGYPLF